MKMKPIDICRVTFALVLCLNCAFAFDLDETVDDDIRKNYNAHQLVNDYGKSTGDDLPELPAIIQNNNNTQSKNISHAPSKTTSLKPINYSSGNIKIKKGTTFDIVSSNAVSDWQQRGTRVKFVTKKQIYTKNITLPAWTVFSGEIVESHQPQITCNGGLVAIQIDSMTFNNKTFPINAYVTRAHDKKIFFNDIKGERKYLKTMWKKGNWGRALFDRMLNLTIKLGADGSTLVLSPFPFLYGTICLGLNTLTSPITAFFSKGGHVSIPAGSQFRIKLTEDVFVD